MLESKVPEKGVQKWPRQIAFHTVFQRNPQKFRFSFRKFFYGRYRAPSILWHDGKQSLVSWRVEPPTFEEENDLGEAVASLTGVSLSTAHNIPPLLMPKLIRGRRLIELSDLKPPQIDKIGNNACYRLEGIYAGEKMILWIATQSFLITRIESHEALNGKLIIYVTSYSPKINENIPGSLFEKQIEKEWKDFKPEKKRVVPPE